MKTSFFFSVSALVFISFFMMTSPATRQQDPGFVQEKERKIGVEQPGPHDGGGMTTGYGFFGNVKDLKLVFRKRVLHPGSSIGYHKQATDEIYYILSGMGEMTMNDKSFEVETGDAVLTRPGSSHGLKQTGEKDLVLFISYEQEVEGK
ncbi:MAG: cupin domain-containing protein [Bacteroidota bacterium]